MSVCLLTASQRDEMEASDWLLILQRRLVDVRGDGTPGVGFSKEGFESRLLHTAPLFLHLPS